MTYNIRTGRIEDLCTLVNLRYLENQLNELIILIFVVMEGWKATISILIFSDPFISPLNLSLIKIVLIRFELKVIFHFAIKGQ